MERLLEEERYFVPFLFVFSLLLYLSFLGHRDLWAPVEPRYGEIVRVMFAKGEWIVPTVNGRLYTDKPILFFWLVLVFSHLVGAVTEWTVRLPSALSAVGLVLLTYRFGKDNFDTKVGQLAALILATTTRVVWEARWDHTDMLFTFFFTASVFFLLKGWHRGGEGISGKEIVLGYGSMGLATLTKGMIGFVLPGLIFLFLWILGRDIRKLSRLGLPWGLGVFLLVTAPWFVAVGLATQGQWVSDFLWTHHVQRYLAGLGHREPFYYYPFNLFLDFLPWSLFFIVAAIAYWPDRKTRLQPVVLSLTTWFAAVFLFFSLSDTKRGLYLLPLYPPVALWVAWALADCERSDREGVRRFLKALSGFFLGALALAAVAAPVVMSWLRPDILLGSIFLGLVLIIGAVLSYGAFRNDRFSLGSLSLSGTILAGTLCNGLWIFPVIDQYKSPRIMASKVRERVSPGDSLYIYANRMNSFNFYLEREVIPVLAGPEEVGRLEVGKKLPYLLVRERDLRRGLVGPDQKWETIVEGSAGSKRWKLLRLKKLHRAGGATSPAL